MAKEKQKNKKIVGVWLDIKSFNDLAALAAHQDMKVSAYAVKLVKRGIKKDEEDYENGDLEGGDDSEEFEANSDDDEETSEDDEDDDKDD